MAVNLERRPSRGENTQLSDVLLRAILACWAAALVEWVAVVFGVRQLANIWEVQWGTLWLLPTALSVTAAVGVSWAVWWRAWLTADERSFSVRLAHAALVSSAAAGAYGISSGRHFEVGWRRVLFVALFAVTTQLALPRLRKLLLAARAKWPGWLAVGACASAVLLELVNRWVLVRLYPVFHLGLSLATLGCVVFAAISVPAAPALALAAEAPPTGRAARRGVAASVLRTLGLGGWGLGGLGWGGLGLGVWGLGCIGLLPLTTGRLAHFDNFRWSLLENAPLLSRAVVVAGLISPPVAPQVAVGNTDVAAMPVTPSASLEGHDVLLVTIDALRADHVGAYGYARPTTPNLDALASSGGVRFEHAYCATPHTSYSLTSLMTGKYIRPLLLQGAGRDSDTWASLLRTYGYRTAAFYPPAVFFIDSDKFTTFEQSALGFEYEKKEFLEGSARVQQVRDYLDTQTDGQHLFVWVHLFGPHEPYEAHADADFGSRDIDRYDSEVHAADRTVGELVRLFRERRPNSVAIVTADHGEEFGDHGGRYHGTSVYEEQVRVPLIVHVSGSAEARPARVIAEPVQTIDLLPTVLSALNVPLRPRIRGRDLSALLFSDATASANNKVSDAELAGLAYAETDEQTLLAQGSRRLICLRRVGACKLFDAVNDPKELHDLATHEAATMERLRGRLQAINAGHGQFESQGLRAEGNHWPPALLRGLAGDGDAAAEIGDLLEDADVAVRREAAKVLLVLRRVEASAALRLAVQRDEDPTVRRFSALTLTRIGEGAPLTFELLKDDNLEFRRLAALVLAESGDKRGAEELVAWWNDRAKRDYPTSRDLLAAFAKIREKDAVRGLVASLDDVRLRPEIAATLAQIGESSARGPLANQLRDEPYQTARVALAQALVTLGASQELVVPLRRWLGVPDPLKGGVDFALRAGISEHLGGPDQEDLKQIRKNSDIGELVRIVIPKTGNGTGLRVLVRARNLGSAPASVRVGPSARPVAADTEGKRHASQRVPELHPERQLQLEIPVGGETVEVTALVPSEFGWFPGLATRLVVYGQTGIEISGILILPLQDEVHAPPPSFPATAPEKAGASTTDARNPDPNR